MICSIVFTSQVKCIIRGLTLTTKKHLFNKYSFFVPSARFSPLYKLGRWNGKVSYFTELGTTYISLLPEIIPYLESEGYEIQYDESNVKQYNFEFEDIDTKCLNEYKWPKGHRLENQPVEMYDHQVDIVNSFLHHHKSIVEAATGSGKSLVCVALAKQVLKYGKIIIVEPSADLTVQTANLFNDLGIGAGIVGLGKREFDNDVIIATWQTINSITKKTKKDKLKKTVDSLSAEELDKLTEGVVAVVCDETHLVKATEIQKIFANTFSHIPLRWGLTGTVPKAKEEYFPLITALGPVVHQLEASELQDKGILASCNINVINMTDTSKFQDYDEEIKYLSSNKDKINFEAKLLHNIVQSGNTLVLIQRIETGEKLQKALEELGTEVVFLSGSDKTEVRFKNYKEMNQSDNKLIIATAQIASTGLDIPRIFNLVYIDMGKSFVKTIQSIGRGLRIYTDKSSVNIYDICSDTKFSKRHTKKRIEYYIEKKYPWKMLKIDNWKDK